MHFRNIYCEEGNSGNTFVLLLTAASAISAGENSKFSFWPCPWASSPARFSSREFCKPLSSSSIFSSSFFFWRLPLLEKKERGKGEEGRDFLFRLDRSGAAAASSLCRDSVSGKNGFISHRGGERKIKRPGGDLLCLLPLAAFFSFFLPCLPFDQIRSKGCLGEKLFLGPRSMPSLFCPYDR